MKIISATLLLIWALGVCAQDYPNRPVRLLVGFAPGGGMDTIAFRSRSAVVKDAGIKAE